MDRIVHLSIIFRRRPAAKVANGAAGAATQSAPAIARPTALVGLLERVLLTAGIDLVLSLAEWQLRRRLSR